MPDTPEMRRDIAAFKASDLRHRVAHAPALEATRSELEEVAVQMRERLLTWMIETDDPLLDGPVEPPPGPSTTSRTRRRRANRRASLPCGCRRPTPEPEGEAAPLDEEAPVDAGEGPQGAPQQREAERDRPWRGRRP